MSKQRVRKKPKYSGLGKEFYLWAVFTSSLILLFAWVVYGSPFRISNIEARIDTENALVFSDIAKIKEQINSLLGDRMWGVFPANNVLMLPKKKIVENISDHNYAVESVSVLGTGWNALEVAVKERKIYNVWCERSFGATSTPNCFYIDDSGFAFAKVGPENPSLEKSVKFVGDSKEVLLGDFVLDGSLFKRARLFLEGVNNMGFRVVSAYIENPSYVEFGISSFDPLDKNRARIIADLTRDVSVELQNLDLIRSEKKIASDESKWSKVLDYVDVRFGNKVYFKLK